MKSERKLQDVKKDAESEIRRLKFMLASNPAVTYASEAFDDFGGTFISENVNEVIGYQPSDFLDNPSFWADHIHPDHKEQIFNQLNTLFEKEQHMCEYRFLHKDGSYRWMRDEMKLIRDASGNPLEIIGSWTDITPHKQIEEKLKESEERYRTLFENATDIIQIVRPDGQLIDVNSSWCNALGYSLEEALNLNVFDIVAPECEGECVVNFNRALTEGTTGIVEMTFKNKDGGKVILQGSENCNYIKGQPSYVHCIFYDITERKQVEEELEKERNSLKEVNIALKVLLRESSQTKDDLEANMRTNIKNLLLPYLTELESRLSTEEEIFFIDIIKSNIDEITSSFSRRLTLEYNELTPREIQIANLIRQGRTNKEIGRLLDITPSAVDFHRRNLRIKFNIKGKKTNLRSHLLSFVV
jgi:PAS domain S-box-containing protein